MLPFATGEFLSAHKLNSISRNVYHIEGLIGGVAVPFGGIVTLGDITSAADVQWYIRHKYRYLHFHIEIYNLDTLEDATIYYGGTSVFFEGSDENNLANVTIDLNDTGIITPTPTVGDWYAITMDIDIDGGTPGTDKIHVNRIYESDVTSPTVGSSGASYSAPKIWAHGDYPTAAEMNKYSASLNYLYDRVGGGSINPAVMSNRSEHAWNASTGNESGMFLFHKHRYLHYINSDSNAEISDPSNVGDDVSLGSTGSWDVYDLDQIDWMTPGKIYYVKFATACAEDTTP